MVAIKTRKTRQDELENGCSREPEHVLLGSSLTAVSREPLLLRDMGFSVAKNLESRSGCRAGDGGMFREI